MTYEDALRKAALCLKLANSSNPAEAALAASKAQEIIDRYQLDVNQLGYDSAQEQLDKEPIKDFGYEDPIEYSKYSFAGHLRLASIVSRHNGCRNILCKDSERGTKVRIVGRPRDVQTARYMYSMLKQAVEELTKKCCSGNSTGYRNQFWLGCVDAITIKLEASRKETFTAMQEENKNNPLALVRVNNAIAKMEKKSTEVLAWIQQNVSGLRKGRNIGGIGSAAGVSGREHGRREGASIKLGSARAGLSSGVRQIS